LTISSLSEAICASSALTASSFWVSRLASAELCLDMAPSLVELGLQLGVAFASDAVGWGCCSNFIAAEWREAAIRGRDPAAAGGGAFGASVLVGEAVLVGGRPCACAVEG
jgi:hypothetical protein